MTRIFCVFSQSFNTILIEKFLDLSWRFFNRCSKITNYLFNCRNYGQRCLKSITRAYDDTNFCLFSKWFLWLVVFWILFVPRSHSLAHFYNTNKTLRYYVLNFGGSIVHFFCGFLSNCCEIHVILKVARFRCFFLSCSLIIVSNWCVLDLLICDEIIFGWTNQ